jgi:hypothetical protein
MSQVTVKRSFSRQVSTPREFFTQKEADTLPSMAAAIRLCKKNHPTAANGEIARFLGIRPQWVFNVLNNPPKKG